MSAPSDVDIKIAIVDLNEAVAQLKYALRSVTPNDLQECLSRTRATIVHALDKIREV